MKIRSSLWIGILTAALLGSPAIVAADAHSHGHHHGAETATLQLNHGDKWQPDAPLRKGMEEIKSVMAPHLDEIDSNSFSAEEYRTLADQVDAQVHYMFANCGLEPKADAQLHILLANILKSTEEMRSDTPSDGAAQVIESLRDYGTYFDHSGWEAINH